MHALRGHIVVRLAIPFVLLLAVPLRAQDGQTQKPFKPEEIEQIVAPIALYPDALLAQVLHVSARGRRGSAGRRPTRT